MSVGGEIKEVLVSSVISIHAIFISSLFVMETRSAFKKMVNTQVKLLKSTYQLCVPSS